MILRSSAVIGAPHARAGPRSGGQAASWQPTRDDARQNLSTTFLRSGRLVIESVTAHAASDGKWRSVRKLPDFDTVEEPPENAGPSPVACAGADARSQGRGDGSRFSAGAESLSCAPLGAGHVSNRNRAICCQRSPIQATRMASESLSQSFRSSKAI